MATFMTVSTDAFAEALDAKANGGAGGVGLPGPNLYESLRRPVRGTQIKDETHAVIRCITASGNTLPFVDAGGVEDSEGYGSSVNYANFLITDIQERRAEKKQIIETFGDDYVLFFGEEPRMLHVTGNLLNTADFNWKSEFWHNYETRMRGTKLVDAGARLYFSFDDVVYEGYMCEATTQQSAGSPYMLPLSFQFYITNSVITSMVGRTVYQDAVERGQRVLESLEDQAAQAGARNAVKNAAAAADSGALSVPGGGGAPSISEHFEYAGTTTPEGKQISLENHEINTDIASTSAYEAAGGGLRGVVASANHYRETASFKINQTMNNIKDAFFGRTLRLPTGIYYEVPPVTGNEAQFKPAPTGRPISEQHEEYIRSSGIKTEVGIDTKALESLQKMRLKYAAEFAARVENDARVLYGAEVGDDWRDTLALLGPLAFGAATQLASFGMRRVNGNVVNGVTQPGVF